MRVAKPRLEAAGQLLIDQNGVEIHPHLGHAHALAPGRDAGMQVGQRLAIVEPGGFGHEAFDQGEHAIGPIDEAVEGDPPVGGASGAVLVERGLGARGVVGWRQPQERQEYRLSKCAPSSSNWARRSASTRPEVGRETR